MSYPIEVIAYHGWGFERSCWAEWQRLFTSHQIASHQIASHQVASRQASFTAVDRGYFGSHTLARFSPPTVAGEPSSEESALHRSKILLAHSYGLHLCPSEQLKQADVLIIFSSFVDFHSQNEREKRRSQRVLQQMLQEFQQHPDRVLNTFKIRCGYSSESQPLELNSLDSTLLIQDLQSLNTSCIDIENFQSISNIIVLHGTEDRIVSVTQGEELHQQFKNKTQAITEYFEVKGAGHALPFTHTQLCWNLLSSQLHCVFNLCNSK